MIQPTLSSIYVLGEEISRALEDGDTDNLFRLVEERQKLVDILPSTGSRGFEESDVEDLREALREQAFKIAQESKKAEASLATELNALNRFRKAERGYRDSLARQKQLLNSRLHG